MKCPGCATTCSDLRDICPRCQIDLREAKQKAGIPISHPELTIDQLRERLGEGATTRQGVLGSLRSLFAAQPVPETKPTQAPEPEVSRSTLTVQPPPPSAVTTPSYAPREKDTLQPDISPPLGISNSPMIGMFGSGTSDPNFKIHDSPQQGPGKENLLPPTLHPASSVALARIAEAPSPLAGDSEMGSAAADLFGEAEQELSSMSATSLELSSEFFHSVQNRDEVSLLFELSDESLADPSSEERYTDQIYSDTEREIGSELVQQALARLQSSEEPQLLSLAELQRKQVRRSGVPPTMSVRTMPPPIPAPRARVFVMWILDLIVAIGGGSLLSAFSVWYGSPERFRGLLTSPANNPWAVADFVAVALGAAIILTVLHPLIAALFRSSSTGVQVAGLRVLNAHGEPSGRENLALRALLGPLSLVLAGPILQLARQRTVADQLSSTYLSAPVNISK